MCKFLTNTSQNDLSYTFVGFLAQYGWDKNILIIDS